MTDNEIDVLGQQHITYGDEKIDAFRKGYRLALAGSVATDEALVETVEREVGFGSNAWDMVDPTELAKAFRHAISPTPGAHASTQAPTTEWWVAELNRLFTAPVGSVITPDMKRAAHIALRIQRGEVWDEEAGMWKPANSAEPENTEHKRFVCPKCGSQYWGTSNLNQPKEEWIGHCHGYHEGKSCSFSWKRADDDTVFVPTQKEPK